MNKNVGTLDSGLRIRVGLILIVLAATGTVGPWGWVGILPLGNGLLGWCPAYALFGIKTRGPPEVASKSGSSHNDNPTTGGRRHR